MTPRDLFRIPVVSRDNPLQLLGVVHPNDMVRAYEIGVLHREDARRLTRANETSLKAQAVYLNVQIDAESGIKGQNIA